jgi:hypothetical protein
MATTAFFISEDYLKNFMPVTSNVDPQLFFPFIQTAQIKYCNDILGSKLYNRLIDGLINSNLNSNETALIKLLRPMVGWYAVNEFLPFSNWKIKNKGVLEASGENLTNTGLTELKYLREEPLNQAQWYLQRVQEYLCKNGKLFPQYVSPDNPIFPNKTTTYECDLAFDETHPDFLDLKFFKKYLS